MVLRHIKHLAAGTVMGLAGLFPGVSAGTVALLLGLHGRLIHAMANIDLRLPRDAWHALRGSTESRAALGRLDLGFILVIVTGMLLTTFSGARAVTWLQQTHPGPVMAAFLGLITFGALIPWRRIESPTWREGIFIVPGAVVAVLIALAPAGSLGSGLWLFFFGGMIAMPMMILPGVSGSALLVTIGLYASVVEAAATFDVIRLLTFLAGGLIGLLGSAKGLKWLLERYHGPTMGFLTGLLAGSVIRVWPWRTEPGFAEGLPAAPDHDLAWIAWTVLAAGAILVIDWVSRRSAAAARVATIQGADDEP